MRSLRWLIPIVALLFVASSVAYFFITVRLVGRHVQSSLDVPEPNAFEGPDLIGGYILQRALRGPGAFIENREGSIVVPHKAGVANTAVGALAIVGERLIVGELVNLRTGEGAGWFIIDTAAGTAEVTLDRAEWEAKVREAADGAVPELTPADRM